MTTCRLNKSHPDRAGFTLLEIVLVLAVLLVLAAVTYPAFERVYVDLNLRQSADAVSNKLAGTRLRALDSGLTFGFRYEPYGRRYVCVPLIASGPEANETEGDSGPIAGAFQGELAEGTMFRGADDAPESVETLSEDQLSGLPDADSLLRVQWSAPIRFFPDGTAEQSQFELIDEERQFLKLSVRDLTAAVSVGKVEREKR
jgi:prepilin-type N-terminal cleavage/methylation domain-containing protein